MKSKRQDNHGETHHGGRTASMATQRRPQSAGAARQAGRGERDAEEEQGKADEAEHRLRSAAGEDPRGGRGRGGDCEDVDVPTSEGNSSGERGLRRGEQGPGRGRAGRRAEARADQAHPGDGEDEREEEERGLEDAGASRSSRDAGERRGDCDHGGGEAKVGHPVRAAAVVPCQFRNRRC